MNIAHVVGTGGYLPGEPIGNDEIERLAGPLPDDVREGLSITRRYWMIDPATGEHRENNSDMAYQAAVRALESAEIDPGEVDLLILATGTPDYPLPPVVNLVQERLGIVECATLEIRSGGAGVAQGLDIARMYLERGIHSTAVVIGSEAISPVLAPVFLGRDPHTIRMRDRMPLYMFGDGAGAIVLRAKPEGAPGGVIGATMRAIGGDRKPGIISVGGGTHAPIHRQLTARRLVDLKVDVVGAGGFTPVMLTRAVTETLDACMIDSVDVSVIPEGSVGWVNDSLPSSGLANAGKIVDSLTTMGAVGSAAVPLFLDDAVRAGIIRTGQRVMLVGVESTKWIYATTVIDWS
nr:3-oxoacyl-ACP synthase III family protein [Kibdelosporangium sp. MJ126-NF4]CEL17424.1 3-oxoacyl-[acyl-carrier-protein] synthase, KASIII [Kibdelosporangium sp. MJ126-NF4]CTQ91349.1 3-oxoacyl-[acyl-carrier-protein] synthase, KASIII (EC 2.3.1.180) [Kibdelosporangium sp. MJ126-NF4]